MATYTAKDGKKVMGVQRARRYEESISPDKSSETSSTGGKRPNEGGHLAKRSVERDQSKGATHGLPKVSTSDPGAPPSDAPDELSAPAAPPTPDGAETAPGGPAWESDFKQHGQANDIHITHDSTGSHVTGKFPDGFVHESHHLDAVKAHDAGRFLGGVTPDMEPQDTGATRARDYPIGPKEDKRLQRENKGMGISVGNKDKIPGLAGE